MIEFIGWHFKYMGFCQWFRRLMVWSERFITHKHTLTQNMCYRFQAHSFIPRQFSSQSQLTSENFQFNNHFVANQRSKATKCCFFRSWKSIFIYFYWLSTNYPIWMGIRYLFKCFSSLNISRSLSLPVKNVLVTKCIKGTTISGAVFGK